MTGTSVYFAPYEQIAVGVFEVSSQAYSTIPISGYTTSFKFSGAASFGARTVIFSPAGENSIGVLDTVNRTFKANCEALTNSDPLP